MTNGPRGSFFRAVHWFLSRLQRRSRPDGTFCSSLLRTCGTWPQALRLYGPRQPDRSPGPRTRVSTWRTAKKKALPKQLSFKATAPKRRLGFQPRCLAAGKQEGWLRAILGMPEEPLDIQSTSLILRAPMCVQGLGWGLSHLAVSSDFPKR